MSDVVMAAVFSSLGAALVAIAGAVASIFGPAWSARTSRVEERERERESAKFTAALEFTEALTRHASGVTSASHRQVLIARAAFIATLRQGESVVARFTAMLAERIDQSSGRGDWEGGTFEARLGTDALFAWLRGDIPIGRLDMNAATFFLRAPSEY